MKKIVILDFGNGEVYVYDYDSGRYDDAGDFVDYLHEIGDIGSGQNNCQWMVVEDLKINIK